MSHSADVRRLCIGANGVQVCERKGTENHRGSL
jgi:hypothetical protein